MVTICVLEIAGFFYGTALLMRPAMLGTNCACVSRYKWRREAARCIA